jgi:hypothetical protein
MAGKNEPSKEPEPEPEDERVDWSDYVYHEPESSPTTSLDATDWVALFIASLETIFLPLVILALMLLAIALVIRII